VVPIARARVARHLPHWTAAGEPTAARRASLRETRRGFKSRHSDLYDALRKSSERASSCGGGAGTSPVSQRKQMQMYKALRSPGVRTILFLVFLCAAGAANARDQATAGAARIAPTPQMGFNNWNSTHCRDEFNETMIRGIADKFIELGLKDAGYRYINIDDCWANWQRDSAGNL